MKNVYNPLQMHGLVQEVSLSRQAIQKKSDISSSIVKLKKTMNHIKPVLHKQKDYIDNFLISQNNNLENNKQAELRRYSNRVYEIALKDMNQMFNIASQYFNIKEKKNWAQIKTQFQKEFTHRKQVIDKFSPIEFILQIINIRDTMLSGFLRSIIYRKNVLCRDIGTIQNTYVHNEKMKINAQIQKYLIQDHYLPTKPFYKDVFEEQRGKGKWSLKKNQDVNTSYSQILKIMNEELQEIFSIVRNYAGLNEEQRNQENIKRNSKVIVSLREQIERIHEAYRALQRRYKQITEKDERTLQQRESELQERELQLRTIKNQYSDTSTKIQQLQQKVKQQQNEIHRLSHEQLHKLHELQLLQEQLMKQFNSIYHNLDNIGSMFQLESEGKKELAKDIIRLNNVVDKLAERLGKEKRTNLDLKDQIIRLNHIVLQFGSQHNSNV